jgi:hypothetical protein
MIRLCDWSRLDSTIPVRMVRKPSVKGDLESFLTICQRSSRGPLRISGNTPSTISFNRLSISTDDLTVLFKCSNKNAINMLNPTPIKPAIKTMSSFLGLMGFISIIASSTIRALALSTQPVSVVSLVRLKNKLYICRSASTSRSNSPRRYCLLLRFCISPLVRDKIFCFDDSDERANW